MEKQIINPIKEIKISDSDKLFFTSDTHFCHKNIIKFCNRPFKDCHEMNEALIKNWNSVVPEDGEVWHLGDFCFGGFKDWYTIFSRLNGHIHLVLGNHDVSAEGSILSLFDSFHGGLARLRVNNTTVIWLSHFPLLCWSESKRGAWNLFGHVHTTKDKHQTGFDYERTHKFKTEYQYDVGVDFNDYKPISYDELLIKFKK